jgi:hypothetical protein
MAKKKKESVGFEYRKGREIPGVTAKEAYEAVIDIRDKNGGRLTPEALLEYSSEPSDTFYSLFTRDKDLAQYKLNLIEAARILNIVRLVARVDNPDSKVSTQVKYRAFVNVHNSVDGSAYYPTIEVAKTPALDNKHKEQLLDRIRTLIATYSKYEELSEMLNKMRAIL